MSGSENKPIDVFTLKVTLGESGSETFTSWHHPGLGHIGLAALLKDIADEIAASDEESCHGG